MSEIIEIDFSNITEINCNNVDLTELYVQEGTQGAKLVWSKSNEKAITFSFVITGGGQKTYSFSILLPALWEDVILVDNNFGYSHPFGDEYKWASPESKTYNGYVIFQDPTSRDPIDTYWVESFPYGKANRVKRFDEIFATQTFRLVMKSRMYSNGSTDFLIYLGTQEISATGEGARCIFVAPEAGNYVFYSTSNNAALGYEHDNEVEYNDINRIELSLEDKQEVCIICATNNWENDTYELVVEKT